MRRQRQPEAKRSKKKSKLELVGWQRGAVAPRCFIGGMLVCGVRSLEASDFHECFLMKKFPKKFRGAPGSGRSGKPKTEPKTEQKTEQKTERSGARALETRPEDRPERAPRPSRTETREPGPEVTPKRTDDAKAAPRPFYERGRGKGRKDNRKPANRRERDVSANQVRGPVSRHDRPAGEKHERGPAKQRDQGRAGKPAWGASKQGGRDFGKRFERGSGRGAGREDRRKPRFSREVKVLYEDDAVIALDKPAGLLAVPIKGSDVESALSLVQAEMKEKRQKAFVVHRIDRFASGVLLFAKTSRDRNALVKQFLAHTPTRQYLVVVRGRVEKQSGRLVHYFHRQGMHQKLSSEKDPKAARAELSYSVDQFFPDASLVRVNLKTGLQNQIRAQFSAIGHAVIGDRKYHPEESSEQLIARVALHASYLEFIHPRTHERISVESKVPGDLEHLVRGARRGDERSDRSPAIRLQVLHYFFMLDLSFVREHLSLVEEKLRQRGADPNELLGNFREIDQDRRKAIGELESLQAKKNAHSQRIGQLKGKRKNPH